MSVIAMTREMGTRGKDVAAKLANELGIEVVHHELVENHLADRLHLQASAVHRFLEGEASLWERWQIELETTLTVFERGDPRTRNARQYTDPGLGCCAAPAGRLPCALRTDLCADAGSC